MEDIGENTFLKLREEKLRLKEELEQVKNTKRYCS